jgi:Tfp pilus assembly protein PilO
MKVSQREAVLMWATGLVALLGVSYFVCAPKFKEWTALSKLREDAQRKIDLAERLVAQGPQWEKRLTDLRKKLPQYPADKDVTADLLIKLEQLASQNGLTLPSRDVEKETQHANMCELAVNCKWEGKLEAITHFLFDLQNEDAILDASQLTIAPNEKKYPRGSFTVYCSYSRAQPPGAPKNPAEPKKEGK